MVANRPIIFDNNRFYIGKSKEDFDAEITFLPVNEKAIKVNHTFVKKHLRDHGVALRLVEKMVDHARENNLKIVPTCPYVKRVLTSDDKYNDVLLKK